jgi:hypothetical protein
MDFLVSPFELPPIAAAIVALYAVLWVLTLLPRARQRTPAAAK